MEIWEAIKPHLVDSLIAILAATTSALVAWLRARMQRSAALEAATLAEAEGMRRGIRGVQKKQLALTLMNERLGPLARPSGKRADKLIEGSIPEARASLPPPYEP